MQNKKLLVIDDDPHLCRLLEVGFSRLGATVVAAHDGLNGLEMVVQEKPDLVILDIRMPHMDGLEVCRQMRELSSAPVIILTALHSTADVTAAAEAGAADFPAKPFSPSVLVARAQAALAR
jgi:DNA-binding response OmpR family regulator